jgi:hypothetical protein
MIKKMKWILILILWISIGIHSAIFQWTQEHGFDLTIKDTPVIIFYGSIIGPFFGLDMLGII